MSYRVHCVEKMCKEIWQKKQFACAPQTFIISNVMIHYMKNVKSVVMFTKIKNTLFLQDYLCKSNFESMTLSAFEMLPSVDHSLI